MRQSLSTLITFIILLLSCRNNNSTNIKVLDIDLADLKSSTNKIVKQKDSLISMLPTMKAQTLDCSADIFWKIIKRGKSSIPLLIESLTDTTMTNIYDSCKHGKLNIGEVSYFALEEIAEFPAFVVTDIQFDLIVNDCWNFYDYLFDNKNKKEYQKMVRDFYNTNKYTYTKFDKKELNSCRKQYKIEGKYTLNK